MSSGADDQVPNVSASGESSTRVEWDLAERVAELEAQLAERLERERIRELEITALHNELELRFAYNSALEKTAADQRAQIDWLTSHAVGRTTVRRLSIRIRRRVKAAVPRNRVTIALARRYRRAVSGDT
jgi:DNA primase